jgi:arylsulfatase A-like enzyme
MPLSRSPLVAASALVPWLAGCHAQEEAPARRVVLITCDTLRLDRLGLYGAPPDSSPNLDAFARKAVVYDRAFASTSITLPSLASLMTGRTPDELGVLNNESLPSAEAVTLAERVAAEGLATAAVVSNWVLRKRRSEPTAGLEQGFHHYDADMEEAESNRTHSKERRATATVDAALRWLEGRPSDRFFLWVHFQDPHGPYTPPESFLRPGTAPTEPGLPRALPVGETARGQGEIPDYQVLGEERDPLRYRERYEAEVRYFDHELGRLLAALEHEDLLDDALVLFTADHGESLGEHGWWFTHGQTLYGELVRIPFLVRVPAGQPPPPHALVDGHARSPELVGNIDVFSTVLTALGIEPGPSRGRDLLDGAPPAERVLVQSLRKPGTAGRWEGLTDGRYHLLRHARGTLLFDLATDPRQEHDLSLAENERIAELEARRLAAERAAEALAPLRAHAEPLDATELEAMRGLGYAGDEEGE